ncbi:hypothetical protein [Fervidibacter sacchari]
MSKPTIVNPKALSLALPLEAALKRSKRSVHKTKTASVLLADKAASNIALLPPQPSICVFAHKPITHLLQFVNPQKRDGIVGRGTGTKLGGRGSCRAENGSEWRLTMQSDFVLA